MSDLQQAFFSKRARLNRLEKRELVELTRIRREMKALADKGSVADQKNLAFVEAGIKRAQEEIVHLRAWLARHEGSFGSVWIRRSEEAGTAECVERAQKAGIAFWDRRAVDGRSS